MANHSVTIIKIRIPFSSPRIISDPLAVSVPSPFFVFHAFLNRFKGTCIVNYKYRQRDTVAPSLRLFFHHIIVVVAVARRFSFYPFIIFFSVLLNSVFWTELSESAQATVSAYRTKRKRVEYLESIQRRKNIRASINIPSHSLFNLLFLFYSLMCNNYIHLNPS